MAFPVIQGTAGLEQTHPKGGKRELLLTCGPQQAKATAVPAPSTKCEAAREQKANQNTTQAATTETTGNAHIHKQKKG